MPPNQDDPHATLRKILAHEERLGCRDSAVSGGLEAFVGRWAGQAAGMETARLVQLFADYAKLAPAERQSRVTTVLRHLADLSLPAAPAAARTDGARAAAAPRSTPREAAPSAGMARAPARGGSRAETAVAGDGRAKQVSRGAGPPARPATRSAAPRAAGPACPRARLTIATTVADTETTCLQIMRIS